MSPRKRSPVACAQRRRAQLTKEARASAAGLQQSSRCSAAWVRRCVQEPTAARRRARARLSAAQLRQLPCALTSSGAGCLLEEEEARATGHFPAALRSCCVRRMSSRRSRMAGADFRGQQQEGPLAALHLAGAIPEPAGSGGSGGYRRKSWIASARQLLEVCRGVANGGGPLGPWAGRRGGRKHVGHLQGPIRPLLLFETWSGELVMQDRETQTR